MFEYDVGEDAGGAPGFPGVPDAAAVVEPALARIEAVRAALALGGTRLGEAGLVDLLSGLEAVKSAAGAYQARAAVALRERAVRREAAAGVDPEKRGQGVGAQVALARRESPHEGSRLLGFARAMVDEMPHTHEAFRAGEISEWRATLLVGETACLELEDRKKVDAALMADPRTIEGVGNRKLKAMARHLAEQASPKAAVERARRAVGDRHVSLRPAPDTMAILTGSLPVGQGVAVLKALTRAADLATATGDARSRGQIMADTLVERVTGQQRAEGMRVEIQLVMTDRTLFQGDTEPAHLQGYGVVPAQVARDMIREATRAARLSTATPQEPTDGQESNAPPGPDSLAWIRRLYTAPATGELVGLDSRARLFPRGLRRFIEVRDQTCTRPWCDAPIRHMDHILAWAGGGATVAENGQGTCVRCNHTKEALNWHSRKVAGARHTVETTTPTGHVYRSQAPALPGTAD
ncbi:MULTISPECIES: HNH endonuclease [Micrococcaceae]|uniref:CONSERVED 13E12 REPEAT FAMILY PROTEIN n=1 Tax=Arthrobacter rhombi TaxID=71253 RepID=A0A1R4EXD1_9MICC|nr:MULTISPECIES: HNH endonuclease signature motif containing protein [Micrococcaceae]PCC24116.1 HNH endonuclease [Glutamicibacter sp. BW78]SJM48299.1 CONSERVED 13E12 REPEAT FAMILY PROTEIN [Arthrobacter rhombi]